MAKSSDARRGAARDFGRSLRLYTTGVSALNHGALVYKNLDKVEKAPRDFEEALRIDPGFGQAQQNL